MIDYTVLDAFILEDTEILNDDGYPIDEEEYDYSPIVAEED